MVAVQSRKVWERRIPTASPGGLFGLALGWAMVVAAGVASAQETAPTPQIVAFMHAAVISMDEERVLRDQTVVVDRGRIVAIGPSATVEVPAEALRIDAAGRYLLPALCDMHVHLLGESWNMMLPPDGRFARHEIPQADFLFPYVASGVTTVQSLAATSEEVELREQIARGELLGPRLIVARMVDGPKEAWPPPLSVWVESPAEAEQAVQKAQEEGFEAIKVYSFLSQECYDAIVAKAKELKIDVIGHIPMSLSLEYVLDAGQTMIAHSEEVLKHADNDYSPRRIDYFAGLIAERKVWLIPTLVTTRSFLKFFADAESVYAGPEAAYFNHPLQRGVWTFLATNLYAPIPDKHKEWLREGFERFQRPFTKALHDKGGRLLAGSDALMLGLHPGFSLHGELRELVDVGLTPYEALRTSTTNPFEYLGESDRAGTIAVGKESDLLLVEANPLEDISAASQIAGVLMRGRWLEKAEIKQKMEAIAAAAPSPRPSPSK